MSTAYREQDRGHGRGLMLTLIESLSSGVPKARVEVITLGRTLKKRADDVLAYSSRPAASDPNYTLDWDERINLTRSHSASRRGGR